MTVQVLGPYIPPEPPKPYLGISKDQDAIVALDNLYRRIIAARDEMRLVAAKDEYEHRCSGICVMVADDFALFFRNDSGKGVFFWSPLGLSAFGLRDVKPGQRWSYNKGFWVRLEQTPHDIALWQSYWYAYPEIAATPVRGKKKSDSSDSAATATAAPGLQPLKPLTEAELSSLGL